MSDAAIRAAFETRLKAWASAQAPALPIAFENVAFSPPMGKPYIRAFVLPARTVSYSLDQKHRQYKGIYQVSFVIPSGSGSGEVNAWAASLAVVFSPSAAPLIQSGVSVSITSPISVGVPIQEPDVFTVPVTTQYEADITA